MIPTRKKKPATKPEAPQAIEQELAIDAGGTTLEGTLVAPKNARGVVLFAHASGSSSRSPRNRTVAGMLQKHGIATLLFDLLTRGEELMDEPSGEFRFDVPLLAGRLRSVTESVLGDDELRGLRIGYFGAGAGAAAALAAAAEMPGAISAIVSRGGRPDLAGEVLRAVAVPTLLIVGGRDEEVIELNRHALQELLAREKKLAIVPGATHFIEEPGTLEEVARLATEWFVRHFPAGADAKAAGSGSSHP